MVVLWTAIALIALTPLAWTAEVLIMPSSLFPMHRYTMSHLAEELVKRKHSVTWFEYGLKKVCRAEATTDS